MKEIDIDNSLISHNYNGLVVFRKKGYKSVAAGTVPNFNNRYFQNVVIRYEDSIGIAKQGKEGVRISKIKEKGKLFRFDILCGEFCWIDNEKELVKELI